MDGGTTYVKSVWSNEARNAALGESPNEGSKKYSNQTNKSPVTEQSIKLSNRQPEPKDFSFRSLPQISSSGS